MSRQVFANWKSLSTASGGEVKATVKDSTYDGSPQLGGIGGGGIGHRGTPIFNESSGVAAWWQNSARRAELLSTEGYHRLHWILSTRKREDDAAARAGLTDRAIRHLLDLRERLLGPRTRFRRRDQVEQAVREILSEYRVGDWLVVEIQEAEQETYRQEHRGRPSPTTKYTRTVQKQYTFSWRIDAQRLANAAPG